MTETLKSVLIGGKPVWVDVGAPPLIEAGPTATAPAGDRTLTRTDARGKPLETAAHELAQMDLAPTLDAVMTPIRAAMAKTVGLKEVTVELTLGIKGEVGFFIAKGEANGSVKVTAKWAPPPPDKAEGQ